MPNNARWNIIDVLKVFLFYFLMMQVGIPALLWIIKETLGLDLIESFGSNVVVLSLSLFVNILTCIYIFHIIRTGYGLSIKSLGFTANDWKADIKFGLKRYFIVLPVIIFAGYVADYVLRYFDLVPEQQEILRKVLEEDSLAVLTFMVSFGVLAAPIMEELVFRGFLQSAVRNTLGKQKAILVSGLLFAIVHLDVYIFLQIFILGLLLAYLFEKTGSLIAPITVHIFHNSATLAIVLTFDQILYD